MRALVMGRRLVAAVSLLQIVACGGGSDAATPTGPGAGLTGPGLTWTAVTAPTGATTWRGVAYGSGTWVAVGNGARASSVLGATWTSVAVTNASYSFMTNVLFANGLFVVSGGQGVSTSAGGTTFTSQLLTASQALTGLAYGNGTWVMMDDRFLSSDVLAFFTSTTGGAWTQALTAIPYAQPTSVAFGSGVFVAVGYGGLVATSANGTAWVQRSLASTSDLGVISVTFANALFVAVTNSGKAYRSADGITWTKATVTVNGLYGIAYGNGVFAAVGAAGSIFTSADAITWTRRTWSGPTTDFNGVFYANARFIAAGNSFAESH